MTAATGAGSTGRAVSLGRDGGLLDAWLVPWDTEVFGFPVAEIRTFRLAPGQDPRAALEPFDAWATDQHVRLAACRLEHDALRESMALEDAGFRFVEMVLSPRLEAPARAVDRLRAAASEGTELAVRAATPADRARLESIAGEAFTTGRFLLDWRLPPQRSGERYARWVRSSLASPAHEVVVGVEADRIIGFFITERREDGSVYWHLTAIAPDAQGRGHGLALWRAMTERAVADGATAIETTISAHNVAALSLYSRLGFPFGSSRITLHRVTEPE